MFARTELNRDIRVGTLSTRILRFSFLVFLVNTEILEEPRYYMLLRNITALEIHKGKVSLQRSNNPDDRIQQKSSLTLRDLLTKKNILNQIFIYSNI